MIAFGIVVIVLALNGQSTVKSELKNQQITGTPDMTPSAIKAEASKAGLENVDLPTCNVAGEAIDNGTKARCFAQYMNVHALEATGGYVYSQMGRTRRSRTRRSRSCRRAEAPSNTEWAVIDPKTSQPVSNGARNIWVTETALSTALNMSYMATNLALFSLVVGIALLLSGVGFIVLALAALRSKTATEAPQAAPAVA